MYNYTIYIVNNARGDIFARCTRQSTAADGAVRAEHHKGGQTANETTVLAICYLDNHHRRHERAAPMAESSRVQPPIYSIAWSSLDAHTPVDSGQRHRYETS